MRYIDDEAHPVTAGSLLKHTISFFWTFYLPSRYLLREAVRGNIESLLVKSACILDRSHPSDTPRSLPTKALKRNKREAFSKWDVHRNGLYEERS